MALPSTVSRSNWNLEMLVFVEGGKSEYPEKNPRSRDENQQQTQPTYDAEIGNRTRATLVGGECSHHCAIPHICVVESNFQIQPLKSDTFGRALKVQFHVFIICLPTEHRQLQEGGKPGREPTTNATHIWRQLREWNLDHTGGCCPSPLPKKLVVVYCTISL